MVRSEMIRLGYLCFLSKICYLPFSEILRETRSRLIILALSVYYEHIPCPESHLTVIVPLILTEN